MKSKAILLALFLSVLASGCGVSTPNLTIAHPSGQAAFSQKAVTYQFADLKLKGFKYHSEGRGSAEVLLANDEFGSRVAIHFTHVPVSPGTFVFQVNYEDRDKTTLFAVDPGTSFDQKTVMDKSQLAALLRSLESEMKRQEGDAQGKIQSVLSAIRHQAG